MTHIALHRADGKRLLATRTEYRVEREAFAGKTNEFIQMLDLHRDLDSPFLRIANLNGMQMLCE